MIRMFVLWAALAALTACTTSMTLPPSRSTSLTASQVEDVKQSLVWDLEKSRFASASDLEGIKFGKFYASKDLKPASRYEILTVCGLFQLKTPDGYTNDMAFFGNLSDISSHLHNDRMTTMFVGRTQEAATQLLELCRRRGMNI